MTHTGIYVCVARNSAGTAMTQVRLHVQGTAPLVHQHDAPDHEVTAGTIFCQLRYEMAKDSPASVDVNVFHLICQAICGENEWLTSSVNLQPLHTEFVV